MKPWWSGLIMFDEKHFCTRGFIRRNYPNVLVHVSLKTQTTQRHSLRKKEDLSRSKEVPPKQNNVWSHTSSWSPSTRWRAGASGQLGTPLPASCIMHHVSWALLRCTCLGQRACSLLRLSLHKWIYSTCNIKEPMPLYHPVGIHATYLCLARS